MFFNLISRLVALGAGLLFGTGMMVSGMVDPAKVIGFLDLAGDWDPSLAFVMGGALLIFAPAYGLLIRRRPQPLCTTEFHLSQNKAIDGRLMGGSVLFGLGWGIAGICPGPAVTSLSGGSFEMLVFVVSMIFGIWVSSLFTKKRE
ncbi:YeeE/YedE family protein [Photobacterium atrarenae]|uniref:YeeE/YedE family protein n=1 Tax=Photobacterium atrarenae TaxID=865757 RepID=A0ABY5GCW9_9GAMM|nr:YeeE/YedE family protein [Photobacterium atrarenae]UTV26635.1 YeeE/YedE family protein [Photobacterium atrarenae]